MQDNGLKALINELKSLKIQEAKIKERESVLIRQIEAIGETESTHKVDRVTEPQRPNNNPTTVSGIKQGDRVVIRNKIRRPATCTTDTQWTKEKEQIATVTRVTPSQIHFVTDNGTRTWRAPNNLSKLLSKKTEDECYR
jgi:hypothetical protein